MEFLDIQAWPDLQGAKGGYIWVLHLTLKRRCHEDFGIFGASGDAYSFFSSNAHEILHGMTAYFWYVYSEALFATFSRAKYDESNGA